MAALSGIRVLGGCSMLALVLGAVHAYSVLLVPVEVRYGVGRSDASLGYSIALVSLTTAVCLGHRLYPRLAGAGYVAMVVSLGLIGLTLAALVPDILAFWLGFGVLFGAANGLGYGYCLQVAAQENRARAGIAMGVVTAAYAIGATVYPAIMDEAATTHGVPGAMSALIASLGFGGILSALLLRQVRFIAPDRGTQRRATGVLGLWLVYGLSVVAGLMAIGHAVAIAEERGVATELLVLAPVMLGLCNLMGSLSGGWMADRCGPAVPMILLPVLSSVALVCLIWSQPAMVLVMLGVIGLAYGAVIASYPALIAARHGVAYGTAVYGRVFTAWGGAGLLGPWLAGWLYDVDGDYTLALGVAAGCGIGAAVMAAPVARSLRHPGG